MFLSSPDYFFKTSFLCIVHRKRMQRRKESRDHLKPHVAERIYNFMRYMNISVKFSIGDFNVNHVRLGNGCLQMYASMKFSEAHYHDKDGKVKRWSPSMRKLFRNDPRISLSHMAIFQNWCDSHIANYKMLTLLKAVDNQPIWGILEPTHDEQVFRSP